MSDELKRFDSVIEMLTHDCHKYALENARLKAEVERLRLAGDEVVSRIQVCNQDLWCSIHRWNAAKEGKQP